MELRIACVKRTQDGQFSHHHLLLPNPNGRQPDHMRCLTAAVICRATQRAWQRTYQEELVLRHTCVPQGR
jgi:hypothetical protein